MRQKVLTNLARLESGAAAHTFDYLVDQLWRLGDQSHLIEVDQLLLDTDTSRSFVASSWFPVSAKAQTVNPFKKRSVEMPFDEASLVPKCRSAT
jgi:hypothetical protein